MAQGQRVTGQQDHTAAPGQWRGSRPDLRLEKRLLRTGYRRLVALDEVGRGALAGPVTVGAVVVAAGMGRTPAGLRDSKLLTPAARDGLVGPIRRWAIDWAVGHASPGEIDARGMTAALRLAAWRALDGLAEPADAVLLDGNHDYVSDPAQAQLWEAECIAGESVIARRAPISVHLQVKGDLRCASVAAASVLAKTTRDALMVDYAVRFPDYGWSANKGYGTVAHRSAIAVLGPCELHRRSWHLTGGLDPVHSGE